MDELRQKITEHIAAQGGITFADFMEMALYYPGLGYYTSSRQRVGAGGDFFTSPATHPAFAAAIAVQLEQMWRLLGCPEGFTIVEMGAGKGLLADDMLAFLPQLSPRLAASAGYIATERDSVTVRQGGADIAGGLPRVTGCFLSNELLDAMPTHRMVMRGGQLLEIYVTVKDDRFVEVVDRPSTPQLEEQLEQEGVTLPEGYQTEINLNIAPWMQQVAERLERGFVITIDYGYPAAGLYAPQRRQGTLLTYYRHTCGSDPYARIGRQDITSHVDFTAAINAGEHAGLHTLALTSQRQFLLNLGLDAFLESLPEHGLSYQQYLANRFALLELLRPEGMGSFRVLLQGKGTADVPLYGITPENEAKQALGAGRMQFPLLDARHTPLLQGKYPNYPDIGDIW